MKFTFFLLILCSIVQAEELESLKENKETIFKNLTAIKEKRQKPFQGIFERMGRGAFNLPPDKENKTREIRFLEAKDGKIYFTTSVSIIEKVKVKVEDEEEELTQEQIVSQEKDIYSIDKDMLVRFDKAIPPAKIDPNLKPDPLDSLRHR